MPTSLLFEWLSADSLERLSKSLKAGRMQLPCVSLHVGQLVPSEDVVATVEALNEMHTSQQLQPQQLGWMLGVIAHERRQRVAQDDVDLVWSGPEVKAEHSRETGTVVRELFGSAQHRVLVASYVIDTSHRGRDIFKPLAERMAALPALKVRCFFSIVSHQGESKSSALQRLFNDFKDRVWPAGVRLPDLYYDPRSLETGVQRACLHAKCIVVDGSVAFITSANFTEAAQMRNIEAGVLVRRANLAQSLEDQLENLRSRSELLPLVGI